MATRGFFTKIHKRLIVSLYAHDDYNNYFTQKEAMIALARSVVDGGVAAVRVNLTHIPYLRPIIDVPIIGIEKIYKNGEMRITPTLQEVKALVECGADAIAIDATQRPRFDDLSMNQFLEKIKALYNVPVIGDVSTQQEAIDGAKAGLDAVGTTLAGYTPYSKDYGALGDIPPAEPDYEIITELVNKIDIPVIAEGRFNTPEKGAKALQLGAHSVVVGTAISNPQKITELFCHIMASV